MSAELRSPTAIRRDRMLSVLGMVCGAYPTWFGFQVAGGSSIELGDPFNWIALGLMFAGVTSFLYHVAIWSSLKYPVHRLKAEALDQLDDGKYELVRIPVVVKIFAWYTVVFQGLLAIVMCFGAAAIIRRSWGYGMDTRDLTSVLLLPAALFAVLMVLRTLFTVRIIRPKPLQSTDQ